MDRLEIRGMREADWPQVAALISTEWEANHPVLEKDFFLWQHTGFGTEIGLSATPLAFVDGSLVGMRGVIPGRYQVPQQNGDYQYVAGGAFAMWLVAKHVRGRGIGNKLLEYCENQLSTMVALGSNEASSVPIYLKNGFSRVAGLDHWYGLITARATGLMFGSGETVQPLAPPKVHSQDQAESTKDARYLAQVWGKFSARYPLFSVHRTAEFWNWRYFTHPTFDYEVLRHSSLDAFAVVRTESVDTDVGVLRVLRIIEIVADSSDGRAKNNSSSALGLIRAVIQRKSADGIDAIDFRASNRIFERPLTEAGLKLMPAGRANAGERNFAGQLNPLRLGPSPINLHWKIDGAPETPLPSLYFTKADSDMDRPNSRGTRSSRLPPIVQ